MNKIKKYIDEFTVLGNRETGMGGIPTNNLIEECVIDLCKNKQDPTFKELKNIAYIKIKNILITYAEWKGRYADFIEEEVEKIENDLKDFAAVIECPLEDVPLYVNSGPAPRKIAIRRLKDAK